MKALHVGAVSAAGKNFDIIETFIQQVKSLHGDGGGYLANCATIFSNVFSTNNFFHPM